jgi:DNA-binding response OmpR family regulator
MLKIDYEKTLIMIIDDEMINLRIVDSMLKTENFKTLLIQNPLNALETAVTNSPDIILLDISMPGKDGFTVCRELKDNVVTAKIPVLFLTGQHGSEFVIKGLEAGAQDYITKPFNAPELIARVETHVKLKLMFEQLIEAEQIKALHAAMVSQNHNMNQLTTSILGHVEILEMIMNKSPECNKCMEGVKAIEKAALDMDDIIRKFTKISKIKFAKYSEKTEMLDLDGSSAEEDEK